MRLHLAKAGAGQRRTASSERCEHRCPNLTVRQYLIEVAGSGPISLATRHRTARYAIASLPDHLTQLVCPRPLAYNAASYRMPESRALEGQDAMG
jgi:hypothetical protein